MSRWQDGQRLRRTREDRATQRWILEGWVSQNLILSDKCYHVIQTGQTLSLQVKRRDLFHHCSNTLPRDYFRLTIHIWYWYWYFLFPSVVLWIWRHHLFHNHPYQNFLHRPRHNLPDCLLEAQCRCNPVLLIFSSMKSYQCIAMIRWTLLDVAATYRYFRAFYLCVCACPSFLFHHTITKY